MSSLSEGLYANMTVGGSVIALLAEVEFECQADAKEWGNMGSVTTSDVLHGMRTFKGNAKKGYVDNTYLGYFIVGSALVGTILPRGGTTPWIAGTFEITNWKLTGMKHETSDPVLEELSFIMYDISYS